MKFLIKKRLAKLEKQLKTAKELRSTNIEGAIDIMFLVSEIQDKINRLKIKL